MCESCECAHAPMSSCPHIGRKPNQGVMNTLNKTFIAAMACVLITIGGMPLTANAATSVLRR